MPQFNDGIWQAIVGPLLNSSLTGTFGEKIKLHKPNNSTYLTEAGNIQWGFDSLYHTCGLITCITSSPDKIGASYIQSSVHTDFQTSITFLLHSTQAHVSVL